MQKNSKDNDFYDVLGSQKTSNKTSAEIVRMQMEAERKQREKEREIAEMQRKLKEEQMEKENEMKEIWE